MLIELVSSAVAASITGWATLHVRGSTNDCKKIAQILYNAGLGDKDSGKAKPLRPLRKSKRDYGTEYAYKFPLGYSFSEFEKKREAIQDGLNSRSFIDVKTFLRELTKIKLNRKFIADLRQLLKQKEGERKTVELDFNGALIVRVYSSQLTERFDYDASLFDRLRGWEIPVGTTLTKLVRHDFDKHAHVIVAGMTDYGKSVFLKNIITTLVARQTKNLKLFLVDLKGGLCFNRFRNLEQVEGVAKNPAEARAMLTLAQAKMEKVMDHLLLHGYEDIKEAGIEERNFVIIDESADIADDKVCQEIITDIARRGRAAGFRLVLATQYPTNETLKSQVRQNISAQICFRLKTEIASRAVLDEGGAELLPLIKGRAIYRTDRKIIVQTPFISNEFIDETIKPHVTIRSRKEGFRHEAKRQKEATPGTYTLQLETTRFS